MEGGLGGWVVRKRGGMGVGGNKEKREGSF